MKEAYLNAIILKSSSVHILMMLLWHVKVCIGTHGSNCGVHYFMLVNTIAPPGSCSDGDIRLAKNSSINDFSANGTIEVCYTGVWGAVCAEYGHWDVADGTVACRQLGYEILS